MDKESVKKDKVKKDENVNSGMNFCMTFPTGDEIIDMIKFELNKTKSSPDTELIQRYYKK